MDAEDQSLVLNPFRPVDKIAMNLLRSMLRIRMVEQEIAKRYPEGDIRCPVHLSIGQEAAAVGICSALNKTDWVFSGHRSHAHYLAKGGDLDSMIAELYGKETGCCAGKGGSMHLTDLACGFVGATPIVGSTVPIAVGAALTAQQEEKERVVVVFLGDGAMESGVVSESLNFAAVKSLPIIFACENNLYSVYSPKSVRQPSGRALKDFAEGHGVKSIDIDGNCVKSISNAAEEIVAHTRRGLGPYFIELSTYRYLEHCGPEYDNDIGYRTTEEFEAWKKVDPIDREIQRIGINSISEFRLETELEINAAFEKAIKAKHAAVSPSAKDVYAETPNSPIADHRNSGRIVTFAESIREALDIELSRDKNVYLMGLGVPDPKGIFGTTLGLQVRHGENRVFDTPLSEHAMTGIAVGSAITGMRPILTHQRFDFCLVSIDQIVNQAAKWYFMFDGTMNVPLVIRIIVGRGWGQGPQHSQSLHSWFAHIPGLKVVMPATGYDAKGLLESAIVDNNPVLFIEHRWLHHSIDNIPEDPYYLPLGKANIIRNGSDITLIGVSYMTLECIEASNVLGELGISSEVIDLISINPIDSETLIQSSRKTGYVVIADHAERSCGISAEISSLICENCFSSLKGVPKRVTLPNYPTPTGFSLSADYYPTSSCIVTSALELLGKDDLIDEALSKIPPRNAHDQPYQGFKGPF